MAHQPNEQQAQAINQFDADLLVSAGAGTGKTSVLTSKYLKLLEERRAEVNQIVAITFTKKAAAEMSSRIGQSIREYAEQAVDPDESAYWQEQLRKSENARISTFHSLCLGLIREHPVEAGLSPATGVLDDGEESLMLNETIANTLTEAIREQELDTRLLSQLLYEYGWDSFVANLGSLYRAIRESGNSFQAVAQLTQESLQKALDGNPVKPESLAAEIVELLEFAAIQKKLTDRALTLVGNLRQKWPEYRLTLEQSGDLEARLGLLETLKKALPKNLPASLKDRVEEVHRLADALATWYLDQEAGPRLKLLLAVLERIDRHFTAAKLEAGRVDFTDQQLLARDLLRNHPQLAEEIRQGINYIMVDEFQDTNSLQLELIELLQGEGYQGGRLMAVGDIKQSIYRFRGAEAGVILNLAHHLGSGNGRIIPLSRNYRSNSQVIEFVNHLSRKLFEGEAFAYEPLEAHHPDVGSRIELVCCGEIDLPEQARLTARRIAQLVRESRNTDAPVGYKDIVILFRASTSKAMSPSPSTCRINLKGPT